MSPNKWGPHIWRFFHSLSCNVKEEQFNTVGRNILPVIKQICRTLPCQICSNHAMQFLNKINSNQINSKNDLINIIYIFHNYVNKTKNKPMFNVSDLNMYQNSNIVDAYNNFVTAYQTRGNMKLMADSFSRSNTLKLVKQFITNNANAFTYYR
jgi:hypothetical protein